MRERELFEAVRAGELSKVRELCEQGADEDKAKEWGDDFRSSLLFAAINSYSDRTSGTPVIRKTGHTEIVAYLLKRGAKADYSEGDDPDDNQTPLHVAAQRGYKDIAALLIQNGADIDAKWEATGDTPLAIAFHSYNDSDSPDASEEKNERIFDTIRLLVDKGADVNTRNYNGPINQDSKMG